MYSLPPPWPRPRRLRPLRLQFRPRQADRDLPIRHGKAARVHRPPARNRAQANGNGGAWQQAPSEDETPDADCPPVADIELTPLIETAARQHQVEPKLIRSVIEQESAFHACAISSKGAKGLMQLMPATIEQFKVEDAFDPQQNIEAGATYLRQLLDKYKGDLKLTLAAYNSGPATVDKTGAIPDIKETQDYVDGVMKKMR